MSHKAIGRLVAQVGPVAVAVIGAPSLAIGFATVIVATGAAAALALAGYGIYRYLSASKGQAALAALGSDPAFDEDQAGWHIEVGGGPERGLAPPVLSDRPYPPRPRGSTGLLCARRAGSVRGYRFADG